MRTLMIAMSVAAGFAVQPALAGKAQPQPCNPCAMHNPCHAGKTMTNPCHRKMDNPCHPKRMHNPCHAGKTMTNPCHRKMDNPCHPKRMGNPCHPSSSKADDGPVPIRPKAFGSFREAVAYGAKLWRDERLGTAGVSCSSCHSNYALLHFDRHQTFPHYVKMVGDVVTLDQMINFCMLNPMKGKAFAPYSKELTALAAYIRAYRMQYEREHRRS